MAEGILAKLAVRLSGDISQFQKDMRQAKKELAGFVKAGEQMKDIGQNLSLYVSAPLAVFGGLALKVSGDFQSGMNRVQAATQATGADLDALKGKAKELGANTKFSALEAASGLETLAKNGLSTAQILGGAIDASLSLAAATGGTLATSADIATDVMNNFGKTASQLPGLVDQITGSTLASKFGIDDYKLALGQAGAVAGQAGIAFTDFNTAIALTSSGFSSGSDAGTSFKTFIQRLVPQSTEAAEAMQKLGLRFFDAQGKMKPLRTIAEDLKNTLGRLNEEQKNQFGTQIFGADSIRTALLLAKDGAAGFDKMAESIGKVDAAAQAKTLTQGFKGAMAEFKSGFESFQIALGDSGILDFGTNFLKTGTEALRELSKLNPEILKFGAILAGVAAAAGPLLFAIGSISAALPAITVGFAALTGPVGLAVAAIAGAAVLIIANWDSVSASFQNSGLTAVFKEFTNSISGLFDTLKQFAPEAKALWESFLSVFTANTGAAIKFAVTVIKSGLDIITQVYKTFGALFRGDWQGVWDGAKNIIVAAWNGFTKIVSSAVSGILEIMGGFTKALKLDGISNGFNQAAKAVDNFGKKIQSTYHAVPTNKLAEVGQSYFFKVGQQAAFAAAQLKLYGKANDEVAKNPSLFIPETKKDTSKPIKIESFKGVKSANSKLKSDTQLGPTPDDIDPFAFAVDQSVIDSYSALNGSLGVSLSLFENLTIGWNDFKASIIDSVGSLTDLVKNGLTGAFHSLADGIGNAFANGENLFDSVLKSMRDFAKQYGLMAIKWGAVNLFINPALGAGAILAGTALLAFGGGGGGKGAAKPSGSSGGGSSYQSPRVNAGAMAAVGANNGGSFEFVIKGTELVGVLRNQGYKNGR